ncbi:MAG: helix-turn-helix transcriptional regulator [Kofleriaceae bacterium]
MVDDHALEARRLGGRIERGGDPPPILGPKVTPSARRRAALGAFLRDRRAKLTPEIAGITGGGRRRTPGLRREEVAQRAGVSVAWYTWLEQGRDIHPSTETLEAIVGALGLNAEERGHAFALAGRPLSDPEPAPLPAAAPPAVQAVLDALAFPAYAADRVSNVLAWNRGAERLFGYARRAPADRNSLVIAFGDPAFRARLVNWSEEAAHLVAGLRRVADEAPGDPAFERLLERLRGFPEFRKLWARHEVRRRHVVRKQLRDPALGLLAFEAHSYTHALFGVRLVVFVPDPPTAAKLRVRARPRQARHVH